jgi:DMSO/TMAO reductase YedYZ molybdopterin-dependent catalytic subunit
VPAALVGAVAAGAALATGEIVSAAVDSEQSLVTAIGTEFIDRFAARLKELAVSLFGTNDKAALVTGIVIVAIGLGAVFGLAARRRWIAAPLGFAAFGVLGCWAMATDPQGATSDAVVTAIGAVSVGAGTFMGLWWLAGDAVGVAQPARDARTAALETPSGSHLQSRLDRRRFVIGLGGVVAAAGGATAISRRMRASDSVNAIRRSTVLPRPNRSTLPPSSQPFEVDGLTPYVTPNDDFYRIDTALMTPQVGAAGWTLSLTGMVDTPIEISYDELLAMDSVEEAVTIQCVSNEVGGHLVGNAVWQGVPLATLLERAGVQDRATQIVGRSVDGFTAGFPTSAALDGRTALVAYAMNGEPLPADHGYPARLIVAGLYGYVSATKWLSEIELTTWEDFDGYWVPRGWSKEGPIKTASRIDVPSSGANLTAGLQPIAGVAWAPNLGIDKVEVQVDDGDWHEAELGRTASDDTWVQWYFAWAATSGDHTIRVRATDRDGNTQTSHTAPPAPDGSTGWHSRDVSVA